MCYGASNEMVMIDRLCNEEGVRRRLLRLRQACFCFGSLTFGNASNTETVRGLSVSSPYPYSNCACAHSRPRGRPL